MAPTAQAICKNTFISFVIEPEDVADDIVPASLMAISRCAPRSRSAECLRCRPETEEFEELSQQSLHRLNAVLSVGMSSPRQGSCKDSAACKSPAKFETPAGMSDLKTLQDQLGKALATSSPPHSRAHSPLQKPWAHMRNVSNCSLSTMAPDDDASDIASLPCNSPRLGSLGMKRMPKVWSSGSVSSMVSWADMADVEEDGEVEFELDIEAGAQAALSRGRQSSLQMDEHITSVNAPRKVTAETGPSQALRQASESMSSAAIAPSSPPGFFSVAPRKVAPEMSHGQVPKNQNMEEMFSSSKDEPITTMMIRNIPGRYSQNDLMMDLSDLGLAETYDFLYLPMDKATSANVGYAFVNFVHPSKAQQCIQSFEKFRFQRHQRSSNKWAKVSVAHLQGLEKNLAHYEKSAVNVCKEKRRRPVVMANIAKTV